MSNQVNDPGTSSVWRYDSNWALRLTAEREVAPNTAVGLVFNHARLPLAVVGTNAAAGCNLGSRAEGTIASYGVMVRSGGGPAFHFAYEGFLGAMQFSNFTIDGNSGTVTNETKNVDFAWGIGTGVGYSMSRDFQLLLLIEYATNVHERGEDIFQRRTAQHYTTRLGVRVGL